jgi:mitotic spindle assembly checkpoint protein MAD2B
MGPKKTSTPTNYISLVAHFLDFLTISIHTILYERNVYPAESFISARKYNYPVRQSRHPDVCEWINDAINHIEKELMKCTVERVSLVIFSRWDDPLERFVFDLSRFPIVKRQDWYTTFAGSEDQGEQNLPLINMEEQFRAVMAKLAFCHRELEPLPEDCNFNIAIELRDEADPPIGHPQPWIPVVPSLQKEKESEGSPAVVGEDLGGVSTTPLRLVDAGAMSFEMWIEEGKTKIEALDKHLYDEDEDFDHEMHRVYERDFQPLGEFLAQEMDADSKSKGKGKERMKPEHASVEDDPDDNDIEERISQFSFMEGS